MCKVGPLQAVRIVMSSFGLCIPNDLNDCGSIGTLVSWGTVRITE